MPCGGINPTSGGAGTLADRILCTAGGCWVCDRGGCKHFCDEWDTYIHARCVPAFLSTEEGQTVIDHGHVIHLDFGLEAS
jgi:hypothetical protein